MISHDCEKQTYGINNGSMMGDNSW